jgi:hypothetical protein
LPEQWTDRTFVSSPARNSRPSRFPDQGTEALGNTSRTALDNAVEWAMSILIFLIVVLVVLALAIYLIDLLPIPNSTIKRIIQALCVLVALYVILERTGVLR